MASLGFACVPSVIYHSTLLSNTGCLDLTKHGHLLRTKYAAAPWVHWSAPDPDISDIPWKIQASL